MVVGLKTKHTSILLPFQMICTWTPWGLNVMNACAMQAADVDFHLLGQLDVLQHLLQLMNRKVGTCLSIIFPQHPGSDRLACITGMSYVMVAVRAIRGWILPQFTPDSAKKPFLNLLSTALSSLASGADCQNTAAAQCSAYCYAASNKILQCMVMRGHNTWDSGDHDPGDLI